MFRSLKYRLRRASLLTGLLLSAACGAGDVVGPPPPATVAPSADAGLISDLGGFLGKTVKRTLETVNVLTRLPLNILAPQEVSKTVGRAGGVIEMPGHGLRFVIPPGALDKNVKITIKAVRGPVVAYEFAPHGLKFKVPAQFEQDLRFTLQLPWQELGGGYFKDESQINVKKKTALIDESINARKSNGWVRFPIDHFSGYLVSCD